MSDSETDDAWLPLPEAFEHLSDQALWHAYKSAPGPRPRRQVAVRDWLGRRGPDRFYVDDGYRPVPGPDHRAVAWAALIRDFKRRLRIGKLMATGIDARLHLASRREPIAAELWDVLKLNVERAQAHAGDLKLLLIRVRNAESVRAQENEAGPIDHAMLDQASIPQSTDVPPRISAAIRNEIKSRAVDRLFTGNWTQDANALHAWAKATFPGRKIATPESIRRTYRSDYDKAWRDS